MNNLHADSLSSNLQLNSFSGTNMQPNKDFENSNFNVDGSKTVVADGNNMYVESTKGIVMDSIATNNKQLLLANLYHYFIDNKNYRSAISLLRESDIPIMIPDKNNLKIKQTPGSSNKHIYKINHLDGDIELFANEYLKSESSIPNKGTFLLHWWECLWSLYNFVNTQPLELITSIRPFIDVIKPIVPDAGLAMSSGVNLKSQGAYSPQQFYNQPTSTNPTHNQSSYKNNSPVNNQNITHGFDHSKFQQFNGTQRIPRDTSSSSSPFVKQETSNQNLAKKQSTKENEMEYFKNFQDFSSGSVGYQNLGSANNQFQRKMSKTNLPVHPATQFYSPGNSIASVRSNPQSFVNSEIDNINTMNSRSVEFGGKPDGKYYPEDGVFKHVSNNPNSVKPHAQLHAQTSTSPGVYQQTNKTSVGSDMPQQNLMPSMIQSQSISNQSPLANMKPNQFPDRQFSNGQQTFNQQNNFKNNVVDQQRNKGNFASSFSENTNIPQVSPYTQPQINQKQPENNTIHNPNSSQQSPDMYVVPPSAGSFTGSMQMNDQQQHLMMQMQMKNGTYQPINSQQNNLQFNGNNMPMMNRSVPSYINGSFPNGVNNMPFKMPSYPSSIPEGIRFTPQEMVPMVNAQYLSTGNNNNSKAHTGSGDWGMGNSEVFSDLKPNQKKRKSKTISSTSAMATPTNTYSVYPQAVMAGNNLNPSSALNFKSNNAMPTTGKANGAVKVKQQRGRKPKNSIKTNVVDSTGNSPYTPMESPLGTSDKAVKKPAARKKRTKVLKNGSTTEISSAASNNLEFMDHFAEATFLTNRTPQGNIQNKYQSNISTFVAPVHDADHGSDSNLIQTTNSINHKNDVVESLMNGDDFGLNFLHIPTKQHDPNVEYSPKNSGQGTNGDDENVLLKSFLMDDHFAGLDFNLDNNNTDLNHS